MQVKRKNNISESGASDRAEGWGGGGVPFLLLALSLITTTTHQALSPASLSTC